LATEEEWRVFADVCRHKGLHIAAAQWTEKALATQPDLAADVTKGFRWCAGCCAVRAGFRTDGDGAKLEEGERQHWRKQAFSCLKADLVAWSKRLENGKGEDRAEAGRKLRQWQENGDLAKVRDAAALAKLPADEQDDWNKLWAEVEGLRRKAEEKP
jgi:hypothetical protein